MRLRVRLGSALVGYIDVEHGDRSTFRFDESYLDLADRPVLGRAFEDHLSSSFRLVEPHSRLPPFFENYLPERGSALRALLARKAGVREHREPELLAALGRDLPGAVTVEDVASQANDPDDDVPARDEPPRGPLRFSLAGMQLKFSVLREGDRLTVPVTGEGGRHILKLPGTYVKMPLVEFVTTEWARRSGIDTVHTTLVPTETIDGLPEEVQLRETTALLVDRFDRPVAGGPRIHQEDFAQVFWVWSTDKYGREARRAFRSIARVVAGVCGVSDFEEFLRRLVFVVLSGNADAHLKNWSLRYEPPQVPRLSPAYDLVSTCVFPGHFDDELPLRLAEVWRFEDVRLAHFGRLGVDAGYGEEPAILLAKLAAERIRAAWSEYAAEAPLDHEQRTKLETHLARIRL